MIIGLITAIFSQTKEVIMGLIGSNDKKVEVGKALEEMKADILEKAIELEKQLIQAQSKIITAEATGKSWLQRNWRPMLMVMFGYIIFHNYILAPILNTWIFIPTLEMPPDLWDLLKIGVGGYIVGRSAEKTAAVISQKFKG